ncbi:MAG: hypothetical protein U0640_01990 [Phycisphaerales bacterium]
MVRSKNVNALLAALPILAGGLVGCESYSSPAGVTVPIGGGTGSSSNSSISGSNKGGGDWRAQDKANADKAAADKAAADKAAADARAAEANAKANANKNASNTAPAAAPAPMMGGSVAYYPTGVRSSSALMVEKMGPGEIAANTPIEYMIKVTNISGTRLEDVTIEEGQIGGFNVTGTNPPATQMGNKWGFNLGGLNPNETKTISVKGTFAKAGSYSSCAEASYSVPVCMTVNVVAPALALTKTAPAEGTPCDVWPVKLVVTNNGTGTARGVTLADALPAGLKIVGNQPNFNVGDLAGGQSKEVTFNVQADKTGSFANTATATAQGGLSATSNTTTTVIKAPVLTIDKKCPDKLRIGQNMKFDIVVTNTGTAVANNTTVTDAIPAGARFVSATEGGAVNGGNVTWAVGALNPGQSKTVSVTFSGGAQGALQNTATASCTCAQSVSDSCTVTLQGVPDIGTQITDDDGVVNVGTPHTFRYEVKNQGQIDLTNVKVEMTFEPGLEYKSTSWTGGATAAGGVVTWKIGTLKAGQVLNFTFVGTGTKAGQFVVQSVTTSDQTRAVRNDEQVNYVD